jgi:hypothetical protein
MEINQQNSDGPKMKGNKLVRSFKAKQHNNKTNRPCGGCHFNNSILTHSLPKSTTVDLIIHA